MLPPLLTPDADIRRLERTAEWKQAKADRLRAEANLNRLSAEKLEREVAFARLRIEQIKGAQS